MVRLFKSSRTWTINVGPVLQISSTFISSLWEVKEPTHYSIRVGDEISGVVAVLFSPAEVAGLAVTSLKRLAVYEATKAETATSQNGTLPSAGICKCKCKCK